MAMDFARDLGPGPRILGLLGAECTGKSLIARQFSEAAPGAVVVPEALRTFVDQHGRAPRADEQRSIFDAQRDAIRAAVQTHAVVVADPAPLMTAVYSLAYFGDSSLLDEGLDDVAHYDLVAWCRPDIPWTPDGAQRDGPQWRDRVDALLADEIIPRVHARVPIVALSGTPHDRHRRLGQAWRPDADERST